MLENERAWAARYAATHRFSWMPVLFAPLCISPFLFPLLYVTGLGFYQKLFDPRLDVDHLVVEYADWVMFSSLLLFVVWAARNVWRAKNDPNIRYWQSMPSEGLVEIERHTLVAATSLWSDDYTDDCITQDNWADGSFNQVRLNGMTQWVVARTAAGHWLMLKKKYVGDRHVNHYNREKQMRDEEKRLKPAEEIVFAFAPGTHVLLGQRDSGAPVLVVHTPYWVTDEEYRRLLTISNHYDCLPPDRYAVVKEQDVEWLERLLDKATELLKVPAR